MIVTGNQLHRVTLALARVVGVLADAAGDIDQVALLNLGGTLDQLAEQHHLVAGRDLAAPADDAKLGDVLHGPVLAIDQAHS